MALQLKQQEIRLNEIRVYAYHGVLPQEKITGAWFVVSVALTANISKSIASDNIADTLNYAHAARIVQDEMQIPSDLLEHVAGRIAKRLQDAMPSLQSLTVSIQKENPPLSVPARSAQVTLTYSD